MIFSTEAGSLGGCRRANRRGKRSEQPRGSWLLPITALTPEQIVYLFIARWTLSYFSQLVFRTVGLRISGKLRLEYLRALFELPVSVLDTLPSGQASNTITTTSNVLQIGISDKLGTLLQSSALLVTAVIVAFKFSWSLTLVTSSILLFMVLVYGTLVSKPIVLGRWAFHTQVTFLLDT